MRVVRAPPAYAGKPATPSQWCWKHRWSHRWRQLEALCTVQCRGLGTTAPLVSDQSVVDAQTAPNAGQFAGATPSVCTAPRLVRAPPEPCYPSCCVSILPDPSVMLVHRLTPAPGDDHMGSTSLPVVPSLVLLRTPAMLPAWCATISVHLSLPFWHHLPHAWCLSTAFRLVPCLVPVCIPLLGASLALSDAPLLLQPSSAPAASDIQASRVVHIKARVVPHVLCLPPPCRRGFAVLMLQSMRHMRSSGLQLAALGRPVLDWMGSPRPCFGGCARFCSFLVTVSRACRRLHWSGVWFPVALQFSQREQAGCPCFPVGLPRQHLAGLAGWPARLLIVTELEACRPSLHHQAGANQGHHELLWGFPLCFLGAAACGGDATSVEGGGRHHLHCSFCCPPRAATCCVCDHKCGMSTGGRLHQLFCCSSATLCEGLPLLKSLAVTAHVCTPHTTLLEGLHTCLTHSWTATNARHRVPPALRLLLRFLAALREGLPSAPVLPQHTPHTTLREGLHTCLTHSCAATTPLSARACRLGTSCAPHVACVHICLLTLQALCLVCWRLNRQRKLT